MSQLIFDKLSAVRRKHLFVTLAQGIAAAMGAAVLLLAAGIVIDYYFELSRALRAVFLALDAAVLGYIVVWHLVTPILFGPDDESVALMVEHEMPEFSTRLIASVQLANPAAVPVGASRSIVHAMINQTEQIAAPRNFNQVIKPDTMLRTLSIAALIVLFGSIGFVLGVPTSKTMLQRAMLLSDAAVPRRTQVLCLSKDQVIAIGDSVTIEAAAVGENPERGKIELRYVDRTNKVDIEPTAENKRIFRAEIKNVRESFDYVVKLNDGRSEPFRVRAVPRPSLVSIAFEQEYPAYTNQPRQKREAGSLAILPGSTLHMTLRTNKPVTQGAIRVTGTDEKAAVEVDSTDHSLLRHSIKVTSGVTGVAFSFVDDDGISSRDSTVFQINTLQDEPPKVRITRPIRSQELATQQARVLIAFEANDDFGVAKVALRHKLSTQQQGEPQTILLLDEADARALGGGLRQIGSFIAEQKEIGTALRAKPDDSNSIRDKQLKLVGQVDAMRSNIPSFGGDAAMYLKNAADSMQTIVALSRGQRWESAVEASVAAISSLEQSLSEADLRRVKRQYEFDLGRLRPLAPEGSTIEFWIEVFDGNNETGPSYASSEHYTVKIVSEEEKRADLMNRLNEQLGNVQNVTGRQDQISRDLGSLIQEKR